MNKRFPDLAMAMITLVLVLAVVGCAAPQSARSSPPTAYNINDQISSSTVSTSVVERYLNSPGAPYTKVEILQGVLPGNLPADIPVPGNTNIVGSVVRSGKYTSFEIVLDVPQQPDKVIEFYRDKLTSKGWEEERRPSGGGFQYSQIPFSASFCMDQKISLNVSAYAVSEGKFADVRLYINNDPQSCKSYAAQGPVYPGVSVRSILPALSVPSGAVRMSGGGGGGSDDRVYSMVSMEANLATDELETHYQAQLLEAGWKLVEKGAGNSFTWSTWTFTDDRNSDWSGLLLIRAQEGNYKILYLVADLIP